MHCIRWYCIGETKFIRTRSESRVRGRVAFSFCRVGMRCAELAIGMHCSDVCVRHACSPFSLFSAAATLPHSSAAPSPALSLSFFFPVLRLARGVDDLWGREIGKHFRMGKICVLQARIVTQFLLSAAAVRCPRLKTGIAKRTS